MQQKSHDINKKMNLNPLLDAKQESEKKIGERFMLWTLSLLAHRDQLGNSCVPGGLHSFPQALPTGSQRLCRTPSDAHRSGCKDR